MVNQDKVSLEFHNQIVKYIQGSNWCVFKSTNELYDILKKYSHELKDFLKKKDFRERLIRKSLSSSLIYFYADSNNSYLSVWDAEGSIFKRSFDDNFNLDQAITFLEEYENEIQYEAIVISKSQSSIIIDGGTRLGFHRGDRAKLFSNGKSLRHPRTGEFIGFNSEFLCGGVVEMSTYNKSYIKPSADCLKKVNVGSWARLINIDNNRPSNLKEINRKKIIEVQSGFGVSSFSANFTSADSLKFSGPKFSFEIDSKLLITRNISFQINIGGLYSILSPSLGNTSSDLLNTFGNFWNSHLAYRYWILNFSKESYIDFGIGYSSNHFGFNSNPSDRVSGQTFYGLSLKSNFMINLYGVNFFGDFNFLPNGGFSQDIRYLDSVDNISSYEVKIGALFDIFSYQNIFSLLKISKYRASSSLNSTENAIQDIGIVLGFKFKI